MMRINVIILNIFIFALNLHSQDADKRLALVIGNGNYPYSTLANPENDARSIQKALNKLNFTVLEFENLNQKQMKLAIDEFGLKLKNYDVGLFYYAGHGIQIKGYNYFIPVDADLKSEEQVEYDCVQADRVLAIMRASNSKVNIIILDACRNNPFERSWSRSESGKGLAFMDAPRGTFIAYATAPGSTASDGSGDNGLYTAAVLKCIVIPSFSISQMFQNVAKIVTNKTNNAQIPWTSSSLTADFYFDRETQILEKNKLPIVDFNISQRHLNNYTNPKDVSNWFIIDRYRHTRQCYALIIGINNYQDQAIPDLKSPINEAVDLHNVLTEKYTFNINNVKLLKDAKYSEIIEALNYFALKVKSDDEFLLFFAGQGIWNETNEIGYWLPSDAEKSSMKGWIRNNVLRDYIKSIKSNHTLLISDACFTGFIFDTTMFYINEIFPLPELMSYPSRTAMTSGVTNRVNDESAFVNYFIKALEGNTEQYICSKLLLSKFRMDVKNKTKILPKYGVIDDAGDDGGDFVFTLNMPLP
jgi:uncharacterized caspase-like protein